jgi:SGNH domain (fused to AT3 domains)
MVGGRRLLLICGAALALQPAAGAAPSAAAAGAPCFGAAARDPVRPCVNANRVFFPSLANIDKQTESACNYMVEKTLTVCAFGMYPHRRTVALVGDSHSWHLRGALDYVAHKLVWGGWSVTAPGCSFSDAVKSLPAGLRESCMPWFKLVKAWFKRHREVSTVFLSQLNSTPVAGTSGAAAATLRINAYKRAWTQLLPKTIKHVVVISDTPDPRDDVLECLAQTPAGGPADPAVACATPRAQALGTDIGGLAVKALHSKRYAFVDMTQYFCDAAICPPIIGGALVPRDGLGHITPAFAASLGPFLLRRLQTLMKGW